MAELWDIKRVAKYLRVSERTVYNRVRSGELPAARVGRIWRVRPEDVDAWLAGSTARPAPGGAAFAREGTGFSRLDLEAALSGVDDPLERRLLFVGVLSAAFEADGWLPPVIVGGNAVEFYTGGDYATVDIDLVASSDALAATLAGWGFERDGRHWIDGSLGIVVEAPGAQLDAGEAAHVLEVQVGGYVARVLGVEDLIVDRLNACVHWQHAESCEWARTLIRAQKTRLDLEYLQRRAGQEGVADLLRSILDAER